MDLPEQILLIDKPSGITSFDVIRILRKKLGVWKMGHAGTLDPMASGLMLIGIESGTKALTTLLKLPKTYEAEICFGIATDTGDITGKIVEEKIVTAIDRPLLKNVLEGMVGTLQLKVPAYSAIKQGGEALYKKARRGEVVDTPVRPMTIDSLEFQDMFTKDGKLRVLVIFSVSSGSYIRSIAEELGRRLSVPATLSALRRISIGDFLVTDAQSL
ncbi:MAG: tRNA pseudouridine(55) synthase TruB [Patescibacteria group bacterium]